MKSKILPFGPPARHAAAAAPSPRTIEKAASELHAVLLQAACAISDLKGTGFEAEHILELCGCIEGICADLRALALERN